MRFLKQLCPAALLCLLSASVPGQLLSPPITSASDESTSLCRGDVEAFASGAAMACDPALLPMRSLHGTQSLKALNLFKSLPLQFEANLGQLDPHADFVAHGPDYSVLLSRSGAALWPNQGPLNGNQTTRSPRGFYL